MRLLEILIVGCLLAASTSLASELLRRRTVAAGFCLAAAGLTLIHLAIEGYRWSMTVVYGLVVIGLAVTVAAVWRKRGAADGNARGMRRGLRFGIAAAGVTSVVLGVAPAYVFPVFNLPEPTGPESIGTTWDAFVPRPPEGPDRPAWYLRREVSLQLWYPASAPAEADPLPYMAPEAARATALAWNAPPFILQHFSLVSSHARGQSAPSEAVASFPVVLFSLSGLMTGCTVLAEELASHGYVVVVVGHRDPRWTPFVFDRNGRVVPLELDDERSNALARELEFQAVEGVKDRILSTSDMDRKAELALELGEVQPLNTDDVRLCAFEASRTLDRLETLNRGDGPLAGRLDLDRVAILGFSKGGAVAGQVCLNDSRFRAGVNMDGFMYGDIAEVPLERPFFFMHSENPSHPNARINDLFFRRSPDGSSMIQVRGSRHGNFGDPSIWNLRRTRPGPIDGPRMIEILRAYVRAFLDARVRDMPSTLLDGPVPEYPEVQVWSKPGDGPVGQRFPF